MPSPTALTSRRLWQAKDSVLLWDCREQERKALLGWTRWSPEATSKPHHSVILWSQSMSHPSSLFPTKMWPPAPCKVMLCLYSLIFPTTGNIPCCLWDVVSGSIRHYLILPSNAASFYGMSIRNDSSSFKGIFVDCFAIVVQQQLFHRHSKHCFISFSPQALIWFPIPLAVFFLLSLLFLQTNESLSS